MLEIACFSVSSALAAIKAGADQIELCADYQAGGVTPPIEWARRLQGRTNNVPVKVMIRPRGGNFQYTAEEFDVMKSSVLEFRGLVQGFVFGVLDAEKRVDEGRNRELVQRAAGSACTFHRAIDDVEAWEEAAAAIVRCGFKSILSSGGERGTEGVRELQGRVGGDVVVVFGGGVRSSNIQERRRGGRVEWMHSSAVTGSGEDVDEDEVRKMKEIIARLS